MKRNLYMLALSALAIDVCLAGSFNYDWDVSSPQSSFGGASYKEAAQRIFAAEEWVQSQDWTGKEEPCAVQVALERLHKTKIK